MGGIARAIADIRQALGGDVVSFTALDLLAESSGEIIHVPQSATLAGRLYGSVPARALEGARDVLASCDVVLIHGLFRHHYEWAVTLARRLGKPYLIFPHGALDPYVFTYRALQKNLWWRSVGRRGARHAAGIVFASHRERSKAVARLREPPPQHVVHLPVVLPDLDGAQALRKRMRRQLGIADDDRVLLSLARLDPVKRLSTLIAAFNAIDVPSLHLVIAGPDGPELTAAECARTVRVEARSRVHFPGAAYGEDKRALFAAADAYVSISSKENFGYSLCEALASGMPALVGPGNDIGSELTDANCSWLLERDDRDAVAHACAAFAHAPAAALKEMGRQGRQWVAQRLGHDRFAATLRRICMAVLT